MKVRGTGRPDEHDSGDTNADVVVDDPPGADVRAVDHEDVFPQHNRGVVIKTEEEGEGVEPEALEDQLQAAHGDEDKGKAELELFICMLVFYPSARRQGEYNVAKEEV